MRKEAGMDGSWGVERRTWVSGSSRRGMSALVEVAAGLSV